VRDTKTGEWSEDRSRHECATAKLGGILLVTEVYEIRDFMYVRRPVSRMARGEVG
jgi:hypothetical protein